MQDEESTVSDRPPSLGRPLYASVCDQIDKAAMGAAESLSFESHASREARVAREQRAIEALLLALSMSAHALRPDERADAAARIELALCRIGRFGGTVEEAAEDAIRNLRH